MFSERLRDLRAEQGITQAELSKKLGISTQSYSTYENGREPSYAVLVSMAKNFNVTADYLLGLSDAKSPENAGLVDELGLTEKAIEGIKEMALLNKSRDNEHDKRSYLDILNMLLDMPEFYRGFISTLGALSNEEVNQSYPFDMRELKAKGSIRPDAPDVMMFDGEERFRDILKEFINRMIAALKEQYESQQKP